MWKIRVSVEPPKWWFDKTRSLFAEAMGSQSACQTTQKMVRQSYNSNIQKCCFTRRHSSALKLYINKMSVKSPKRWFDKTLALFVKANTSQSVCDKPPKKGGLDKTTTSFAETIKNQNDYQPPEEIVWKQYTSLLVVKATKNQTGCEATKHVASQSYMFAC